MRLPSRRSSHEGRGRFLIVDSSGYGNGGEEAVLDIEKPGPAPSLRVGSQPAERVDA
ncbi:MAG TPA: hypothetical protein VEH29_16490 [Acidimicrobiales bacterium]|nr:hypothetical protein [Acidimicrobiales bacterium]